MSTPPKATTRAWWPLVLIGVGLVLLAGAAALYVFPDQPAPTPTPAIARSLPPEETFPNIARVSLADAKAAFDAGSAVFVDVRDSTSYGTGHIPGAKLIPLIELAKRTGELKPTDWIITYCT